MLDPDIRELRKDLYCIQEHTRIGTIVMIVIKVYTVQSLYVSMNQNE